jgi:hypothetical protein
MQARTIFVWGLTPIILLVAVYLETKDRPKEPLRSWVAPPVVALEAEVAVAPKPADPIVLEIVIKEAIPLDVHNYWEYKKLWDQQKEEMTALGFMRWQKSQAGLKLRAEGEVGDVGTTGYTNPDICTLTIGRASRPGWRQYMGTLLECEQLGDLRKGDSVALNCVLDDHAGTFDPSTDDCTLEIL